MLIALITKQFKLLLRDKVPLIILLIMPMVLITILSFALAGVMDGNEVSRHTKIAILDETNWEQEKDSIQQLLNGLDGEMSIEGLEQVDPIYTLKNNILSSEALKSSILVEERNPKELSELRKMESYDAIIYIPKDFRLAYIKAAYLNNQVTPELQLYLNQSNEIGAYLAQVILEEWQTGYTQSLALIRTGLNPSKVLGGIQAVEEVVQPIKDGERNIPASVYYTIGMLVMFALYVPSFLVGFSYREVYWKVYNRLLLGNIPPVMYALSIFLAGVCVSFVQQLLLLVYGKFVLGVDWIGWEQMLLVILLFSLFVGSLSAFLSIAQLRTQKEGIATVFTGVIVSLLSFLGGSFFEIESFSESLASIGSYTPNGSAMKMILAIQKSQELGDVYPYALSLGIWLLVILLVSIVLFPKKGVTV